MKEKSLLDDKEISSGVRKMASLKGLPTLKGLIKLQGVPKKMQHSDFSFRSVPEVQFNISTCVSESEF